MVRSILAVVAGYAALCLAIFVTFTALYLVLGADRSFAPGSYDASTLWVMTSFPLGVAASVAAGYVCARIARGGRAPQVLAGLVLVLGLLFAIPVLRQPEASPARAGDVPNMEAMKSARQPKWVALVNPFIGAAGVLFGAGLRRRRRADSRGRRPAAAV